MDLRARDVKLSSRKVADECGVTVATVSKWREGTAPEEETRRDFEEESPRASELSDLVSDLSEANLLVASQVK
jgi:predicted transcriptional regulator